MQNRLREALGRLWTSVRRRRGPIAVKTEHDREGWTVEELVTGALDAPVPPPLVPSEGEHEKGYSAARAKGEMRGSGPSRWHRPTLRVIKGGRA